MKLSFLKKGVKIWALAFFTGALLLVPKAGFAWSINSFQSDIKIEQNSSIIVTETIVADYTQDPHHGLVRTFPLKYKDKNGNNLFLRFEVLSVTDENGKNWPYEQYSAGGNIEIKIGDPNAYLTQPATFKIAYKVMRAITISLENHDELYWNATGNQWDVPIKEAKSTVIFGFPIKDEEIKATCYTGILGSDEQNCQHSINGGKVEIKGVSQLMPNQGLTVVVGFPKNLLTYPSSFQEVEWFLVDNWPYGIPVLVFAMLFFLWYTRGRDPKEGKDTIVPLYTPPENLTPLEVGTLVDEEVHIKDITSTIVDLAVRGYLQIIETKQKKLLSSDTDYEFKKLKSFQGDSTLRPHEKTLLDALFSSAGATCKLADLKNKFYKDIPVIEEQIYTKIVQDGYFPTSPDKIRTFYTTIGFFLLVGPIFLWGFLAEITSIALIIGIAVSGALFLAFSRIMPAKTKKGVEIYYKILGLKEYINTAEKDRLKFQERENIFEKLLPYAMVLGIAEKWSKTFEGIYKDPPNWYRSNDPTFMTGFSTYHLLNRLNHATTTMGSTFQSSPRSAAGGGSGFGGGFSGGGFGGGGGRSW
jgi:uncharacterized membrane protein